MCSALFVYGVTNYLILTKCNVKFVPLGCQTTRAQQGAAKRLSSPRRLYVVASRPCDNEFHRFQRCHKSALLIQFDRGRKRTVRVRPWKAAAATVRSRSTTVRHRAVVGCDRLQLLSCARLCCDVVIVVCVVLLCFQTRARLCVCVAWRSVAAVVAVVVAVVVVVVVN